ncbi:MAG: helix-turn-helix domain-containing protein [Candidatus Peribacter sp.]|jgi:predicted transcriptional regulator
MTDLPASIEAYLTDAGFAQTEILVLRKLLEGGALTLRELAAKTGKSTGVLDAAVKKLLTRRLICRETVNDTPKMLLKSLDAIIQWVKRDTEEKLESMKSRARDFETFIHSLKVENRRPEMEYYEGEEGIIKAYRSLLGLGVKEFLHERPVTVKEEEDPLRAFRVQYFRERHKRGIFSRALAPDTALGRRFQSRDPFEYRETQLLKEEEFPITFEKIIAGETVACFNHLERRACTLKYPELAHTERMMFELLWRRAKEPSTQPQTVAVTLPKSSEPMIALSTRSLSSLRGFFLSRTSVAIFLAGAVLAAGVTYGMWRHTYDLNLQRIKEQVMAIAATAAPEFDAEDVNQIHTWRDAEKPVYRRLVSQLQDIRSRNPKVKAVYIERNTEIPYEYEFVVDADSLDIKSGDDMNGDGLKNDVAFPGYVYYWDVADWSKPLPPSVITEPYAGDPWKDNWGTWISGTGQIRDINGRLVAYLGIDVDVSEVESLSKQSFSPIFVFSSLFLLFVFVRLAAFNRPLFFDLLKVLRSRGVLTILGVCALIALGVTWGMYQYTLSLMKEQVGQRLMAIAVTAAAEIDAKDLEPLRFARDMERPEYQRVFTKLNEIRDRNENVLWVYVMRKTEDPTIWEFVADADANYDIPLYERDLNGNGEEDEEDENVAPGVRYDATGQIQGTKKWKQPFYEIAIDQWGIILSGMSPILDSKGNAVAVLGVDMDITDFFSKVKEKYDSYMWFFATFGMLMIMGVGFSFRKR